MTIGKPFRYGRAVKSPKNPGKWISRPELRKFLGISKQRVSQLLEHPDFPEPEDVLDEGRTPFWNRERMARYRDERRTEHGRPAADPIATEG